MKRKTTNALFTGSFDPVTVGHENVIRRAAALFDTLTVGIFINKDKAGLFSPEEREELLRKVCAPFDNVRVCRDEGMVADFVTREGIDLIVRSVRDEKDLPYERQMAAFNKARCGKETVFLSAEEGLSEVSSTLLRKRLTEGREIASLVPAAILEDMIKKSQSFQQKGE